MNIEQLIRKNIRELKPYSSARDEFDQAADVYLDANENPYTSAYNRYPDPLQKGLKEKISSIKQVAVNSIFLGNGSDEAIDLLVRAFCVPGQDSIMTCEPTYGMYRVCAAVNDVNIKPVLLDQNFDLDVDVVKATIEPQTKIIFLCSPNNPTGNNLTRNRVIELIKWFGGIVVIDEAYIDFSEEKSFINELETFRNLVVLQTFSKAWGLAGLRVGMCFADPVIISMLNRIKHPYNVSSESQRIVSQQVSNTDNYEKTLTSILTERTRMCQALQALPFVRQVYPSAANFLLVRVEDSTQLYNTLLEQGIVVRNRTKLPRCENCLRITIGTEQENNRLLEILNAI